MADYQQRIVQKESDKGHMCFCVGPQNGEPECPCRMRILGIFKREGRWIKPAEPERDLGPVIGSSQTTSIPYRKTVD